LIKVRVIIRVIEILMIRVWIGNTMEFEGEVSGDYKGNFGKRWESKVGV